jgi:hypothetical protein
MSPERQMVPVEEYDRVRAALSVYRVRAPMLLHERECWCNHCEYLRDTIIMASEALGERAE